MAQKKVLLRPWTKALTSQAHGLSTGTFCSLAASTAFPVLSAPLLGPWGYMDRVVTYSGACKQTHLCSWVRGLRAEERPSVFHQARRASA